MAYPCMMYRQDLRVNSNNKQAYNCAMLFLIFIQAKQTGTDLHDNFGISVIIIWNWLPVQVQYHAFYVLQMYPLPALGRVQCRSRYARLAGQDPCYAQNLCHTLHCQTHVCHASVAAHHLQWNRDDRLPALDPGHGFLEQQCQL